MNEYDLAFSAAIDALSAALHEFVQTIPVPVPIRTRNGKTYRYREKNDQQALVIKCVRLLSALRAIHTLLRSGLALDAGALMRVSDETSTDIMFLAAPRIFNTPLEPIHERYLKELFQEEFEVGEVLTRAKRDRVSRSKINAYVARSYSATEDTHTPKATNELIEGVFSGFVHGAAVHIMDIFDGRDFAIPLSSGDEPLLAFIEQFGHYIQRTIFGFCHTAIAIGRQDVFDTLYALNAKSFTDEGHLLKA